MVSVIIPNCMDVTYLQRCINSIRRQTYREIEIILIIQPDMLCQVPQKCLENLIIYESADGQKYSEMANAIQNANGEYIFFCNELSVIASQTIRELMDSTLTSQTVFPVGTCYIPAVKGYKPFQNRGMNFYGKLFKKESLNNNHISFCEKSTLAECLFVLQYLNGFQDIELKSNVYIYESNSLALNVGLYEHIDEGEWDAILVALSKLNKNVSRFVSNDIGEFIQNNKIESLELMFRAERYDHSNYIINYKIAKFILTELWSDIKKDKDQEKAQYFKEYLDKYKNEPLFLDLLLSACGLSMKQYSYLQQSKDLEMALFFINESQDNLGESSSVGGVLDSIRNDIQLLETSVHVLEKELSLGTTNYDNTARRILEGFQPGLVKVGNTWYYYNKGEIDRAYRGLVKNQYGWWYVENGSINHAYSGLADNEYGTWLVREGKIDKAANGCCEFDNYVVWVKDGKLDLKLTGLRCDNNQWHYYKNGIEDKRFCGLVKEKQSNQWWYVENGTINFDFKGLVKNQYGWWYVEDGTINYQYKGVAQNSLGIWEIENGTIKKEI